MKQTFTELQQYAISTEEVGILLLFPSPFHPSIHIYLVYPCPHLSLPHFNSLTQAFFLVRFPCIPLASFFCKPFVHSAQSIPFPTFYRVLTLSIHLSLLLPSLTRSRETQILGDNLVLCLLQKYFYSLVIGVKLNVTACGYRVEHMNQLKPHVSIAVNKTRRKRHTNGRQRHVCHLTKRGRAINMALTEAQLNFSRADSKETKKKGR